MDKADLDLDDNGETEETGQILGLDLDEANMSEIERHPVVVAEVIQVWENGYVLLPNAKRHTNQPYIMVGWTDGGRWLSIPIGPTPAKGAGIWRPATAFPSPKGHVTRARKALGVSE